MPTKIPFLYRVIYPLLILILIGWNTWMFRRFEGADGRNAGAIVEAQGKLNGRATKIEESMIALQKTIEELTSTPGSGAGLDEETRERLIYIFDYVGHIDFDADNTIGFADLCPDISGSFDGCPTDPTADPDGDGVGFRDQCPTTPTGSAVIHDLEGKKYTWSHFQKTNPWEGCADTDADGVGDPGDKCPNTPTSAVVNGNGCTANQTVNDGCDTGTPTQAENKPGKFLIRDCELATPAEATGFICGHDGTTYTDCQVAPG